MKKVDRQKKKRLAFLKSELLHLVHPLLGAQRSTFVATCVADMYVCACILVYMMCICMLVWQYIIWFGTQRQCMGQGDMPQTTGL